GCLGVGEPRMRFPLAPRRRGRTQDEAEIRRALAAYARAIDRLDWELLESCYHPEAVEDRGRYRGDVEGLVEWLRGALLGFEWTWHLLGIPSIDVEGDVALVETYCLAVQWPSAREADGSEGRLVPCRYCDRFERRSGEWRIAARVAVYEPVFALRAVAAQSPMGAVSRRDRDDPAYRG